MKTLKLEVGKTYRSRGGEEVKIVRTSDSELWPFVGDNGKTYSKSGSHWYIELPDDLIEELPETRHTFDIPDGVKQITLDYFGNRIVVEMVPKERKEPKPGDVMINRFGSVYIFKAFVDDYNHEDYVWLGKDGDLSIEGACTSGRPATPEEAQPLWDALEKAGKRWNPETMQVEDVPEFERIREWVEEHLSYRYYTKKDIAKAIEAYLKYREGEK